MFKTLMAIVPWGVSGWLLGVWLAPTSGWILFSAGLLVMLLARGAHLARISAWSRDVDAPPPPALGPWDDVLAPVYRKLRWYRQALAAREHDLARQFLAAEALPDGLVTLDAEMAVVWSNPMARAHLGLHPDADRGHRIFNILRAPEFLHYASQPHWPEPLILRIPGGDQDKTLWIQLVAYGENRFLLLTRDITQMERLETMRRDFVANVSHELRTPLTVLTGFLETLESAPQQALSAAERARFHALMRQEALRMQTLVDELLTLSALEASPQLAGERVAMAELIEHAVREARVLSAGQHTFVEHIAPGVALRGVASELRSAVSNLLSNAVRYTPAGGTITVCWGKCTDGQACYRVEDTGIGIAAADIPRLAERFYRVDRSRSRATGGTGLGLAITKHVAMRHDARLSIDSRLGDGSIFALEFAAERVIDS